MQSGIIKSQVGSNLPTQNSGTESAASGDTVGAASRRAELARPTTMTTTTRNATAATIHFSAQSPVQDGDDNNNNAKEENTLLSRPTDLAIPRTTNTTIAPNEEAEEEDPSFSACLLIMDDNHLLIEWLAYHYTTLPLRRLIVAIDPRSATSPLPVLERWKGRINYTLWYDNDYVGDEILQKQGCNFKGNEEKRAKLENKTATEATLRKEHWTWIHRLRQPTFMNACAKQLKKENRSWTMYIDTDEYLVVNNFPILNKHLKNSFLEMTPQREGEGRGSDTNAINNTNTNTNTNLRSIQNDTDYPPMTSLQMLEDIIKYNVTKNIESSKFLDYHKMYQSGCIGLPRMPISTKDSTAEQMQNQIPSVYNASRFSTLRFRHFNKERQSNGKPVVDLSRVDQKYLHPKRFSVHNGIRGFCANKIRDADFPNSFFIANHYPLSFEQYGFRKGDSRGRSSHEAYMKRYERKEEPKFNSDDMVRGWFRKFVDEVGTEDAQSLFLRGVGELVGDHQDLLNNYSTSLSYENCVHYNRPTGKFSGLPEDYFNKAKE